MTERELGLGPGLHKTGPAPYDWVFNPAEGLPVAVDIDGELTEGVISAFTEDEDSGEITLTVEPREIQA